jgi:hypothetical protein
MLSWGSYSYVFGPLAVALLMLILIALLKWTFRRGTSLVEKPIKSSTSDNYGALVKVAKPVSFIDGEMFKQQLADAGIKSTLALTVDGPELMVWPKDLIKAKQVLVIK